MYSKYRFSIQFLTKNRTEIAPETSGASGLLLPYSSLLKTIRKLLRKPPEPPACFWLTIPCVKQYGNCSGSLRSLRPPFLAGAQPSPAQAQPSPMVAFFPHIFWPTPCILSIVFPDNSLPKTVRKLLRKPPEPPACFCLTIPYQKQ
jgi:hypothetical protein